MRVQTLGKNCAKAKDNWRRVVDLFMIGFKGWWPASDVHWLHCTQVYICLASRVISYHLPASIFCKIIIYSGDYSLKNLILKFWIVNCVYIKLQCSKCSLQFFPIKFWRSILFFIFPSKKILKAVNFLLLIALKPWNFDVHWFLHLTLLVSISEI